MQSDGEEKRLEDAAGPHGARTTELVGVDDIGLPSGIQPEDVKDMGESKMAPMQASGGGGSAGGGGGGGGSGDPHRIDTPPSPVEVHEQSPHLNPGDEAAPGTVGSGDDTCPVCSGSGKAAGGGPCPNCRGTGIVTEGIGGG